MRLTLPLLSRPLADKSACSGSTTTMTTTATAASSGAPPTTPDPMSSYSRSAGHKLSFGSGLD